MFTPSARVANFHYAIRNIVRAAEVQEQAGRHVIYLNIGDPQRYDFRPPAHLVEAVARAVKNSFTGYAESAGLLEAREAVAAYASGLNAPTEPNEVVITAGSSEAADLLLTALVNEGEEVLVPAPGYPLYRAILSKLGAVARHYKLHGEAGERWQPRPEEVRSLINERTRALLLINPNNPTGSVTPDAVTEQLLEIAAQHKLLVIADEVYRELCFGQPPLPASVIAQRMGVPLVTLESLSKTHVIPGWRVGWMRFTHAEKMPGLILAVNRLADGRLCAPCPTQYAVRPALEDSKVNQKFLENLILQVKRRRDISMRAVQATPGLSCETPEAGFYMMIKAEPHGAPSDERFVLDLLQETGVLVVHGAGFGADPQQNYFRLVYLADEDTLDMVFREIKRFMIARSS